MRKIIIGISGASGVNLGIKFARAVLESSALKSADSNADSNATSKSADSNVDSKNIDSNAKNSDIFVFLVLSEGAKMTLSAEQKCESSEIIARELRGFQSRFKIFDNYELDAPISSGSFKVDSMIIAPCSANTLAKINCGISDTLILRAASVCLKERRRLILAPREMPFDTIMLKNMFELSSQGVIISAPILGYYSGIKNLEDMENFLFGKWLNSLNIEHSLFKAWGEK